ncbi:hypothetical protein HYU23_03180 [Candidatus Woesearchaeota archaeon]|nr:hypothetical protein [Candidatus Woesearchaeota archaeon]
MRALILHANKFVTKVVRNSNKPFGIEPETVNEPVQEMNECIVAFFTVEKSDSENELEKLYSEIAKASKETGTKNLMISPFVHLSNNIAEPKKAKEFYEKMMKKFKDSEYVVDSSPFGYHKSLLLDVKGHPTSFRYREFNSGSK